jgi:hypothetical protein
VESPCEAQILGATGDDIGPEFSHKNLNLATDSTEILVPKQAYRVRRGAIDSVPVQPQCQPDWVTETFIASINKEIVLLRTSGKTSQKFHTHFCTKLTMKV